MINPIALETGNDTAWPVHECLAKLAEAAEILLRKHDFDGHGWELIDSAMRNARAYLSEREAGYTRKPKVVACPTCTRRIEHEKKMLKGDSCFCGAERSEDDAHPGLGFRACRQCRTVYA